MSAGATSRRSREWSGGPQRQRQPARPDAEFEDGSGAGEGGEGVDGRRAHAGFREPAVVGVGELGGVAGPGGEGSGAEVEQAAEVEGGGAVVEPGVVLDDAAVGDTTVAFGDEPGDGAFHRWPPAAVLGLPVLAGGGLVAGGFEQVVPGVDGEVASGLGAGAAVLERASGAEFLELGLACAVRLGPAERDGVSGGAGDLALLGVDGEVVGGEPARDSRLGRRRLQDRVVALGLEVFAPVAGAVGGVAEHGDR